MIKRYRFPLHDGNALTGVVTSNALPHGGVSVVGIAADSDHPDLMVEASGHQRQMATLGAPALFDPPITGPITLRTSLGQGIDAVDPQATSPGYSGRFLVIGSVLMSTRLSDAALMPRRRARFRKLSVISTNGLAIMGAFPVVGRKVISVRWEATGATIVRAYSDVWASGFYSPGSSIYDTIVSGTETLIYTTASTTSGYFTLYNESMDQLYLTATPAAGTQTVTIVVTADD